MMPLHCSPPAFRTRHARHVRKVAALCLALGLGLAALPAPSMAAETRNAASVRVVVVNVERLLAESGHARAAAETIEAEFAPRRRQVQAQLRQLREMSDKLAQDGPTLSDREHLMRSREVGELERTIRREQGRISDDFAERHAVERAALAQRIHEIVLALPAELGVDIVLTRTIWHRPAIDVTDKVMRMLDR